MRLAYWHAHQMKWVPLELEERISMALLGLTKAAEKYDSSRGVSFATFARKMMHDEVLMGFRKESKHTNVISLNLPIGDVDHCWTLENLVPDKRDRIAELESGLDAEIALERLSGTWSGLKGELYREILDTPGQTKSVYAKRMGMSATYISRVIRSMREDTRRKKIC